MTAPESDGVLERRTPDYRGVIRKLTNLDEEAAAHRAEARTWHDTRAAEADEAVRTADDRVRRAETAVRQAQRELEEIDARVAGVWAEFSHRAGRAAERFGPALEPAVPRQRDRDAEAYLEEATAAAARKTPPKPLKGATLLYVGIGALGGAVGLAAWSLLRWAGREGGGDLAVGLPVVALVVALLGPILAVVTAKRVADRSGTPLDASSVSTVLIAALITAGLILVMVRNNAAAAGG
ncbi:hypothetical protein Asp14428_78790 [Actinoplanes sp. NBRC 14428]|uniref:Uncharacterized protein n=1 Tax=Pseudosporangium ferrugineum TaxID=439699 RepID=A0A2T0SJT9_9ACTN|nr:hypothetical protein [Pseudosporangium ferrugineum]PRY33643.1 hypothetical protein CLV70_101806 [Pseudosporangium ferrugineum]BCJ56404.1 hypothetical protein Asp14428_78790 [Actinoplanes sp. NBRC 14428]